MSTFSLLCVIIGCIFLAIILLCYIRHLVVFGVNFPCSDLKTDYFGRPYPDAADPVPDDVEAQESARGPFDPDEAARGNKYYPILTVDEARRSSATVSTIKHLLLNSDLKPIPGMNRVLESSVDEDDESVSTNREPQKPYVSSNQERAHSIDVNGSTVSQKRGDIIRKSDSADNNMKTSESSESSLGSIQTAPPERRMSNKSLRRINRLGKSPKIDGAICEDGDASNVPTEDDTNHSADVEDSEDEKMERNSRPKMTGKQKIPTISTTSSSPYLQVPQTGPQYLDHKFTRNKSKSLRENSGHKSLSSPTCDESSTRKRMSLDRILSSQCQYCIAEIMTSNPDSNITESEKLFTNTDGKVITNPGKALTVDLNSNSDTFDVPREKTCGVPRGKSCGAARRNSKSPHFSQFCTEGENLCELCVTESSHKFVNRETSASSGCRSKPLSPSDGKQIFKNTFFYQGTPVNKYHSKDFTSFKFNASQNSGKNTMERSNSTRLYESRNNQVSYQVAEKRRSTTHLRNPRKSPSNSLRDEQVQEAEDFANNHQLKPTSNVRRTRSTRERRRSRHLTPSDDRQVSPGSPRGGSFRERRTSSSRKKLSPRLTSFEDFQNFSLLMAGHKVEIPAWKKHEKTMQAFYSNSHDADISS